MEKNQDRRSRFNVPLKGLSLEIFRPVFLASMDASKPECEPLLLLKLL